MNTVEQNLAMLGPWTPNYPLTPHQMERVEMMADICRQMVTKLTEEGAGDVTGFEIVHKLAIKAGTPYDDALNAICKEDKPESIGWKLVMSPVPRCTHNQDEPRIMVPLGNNQFECRHENPCPCKQYGAYITFGADDYIVHHGPSVLASDEAVSPETVMEKAA